MVLQEQMDPFGRSVVIGNRIPRDYFITTGHGESDITIHAGSYHLALKDANIEKANIMTYSSILPGIVRQIERPETYIHGEVMETIMAIAHGNAGERVTAGIITGMLYHKQTGEKFGGLVCEHNGPYTIEEITNLLHQSINELYTNGFNDTYDLKDVSVVTESFIPTKKYGTALVALCFVNYVVPIITK